MRYQYFFNQDTFVNKDSVPKRSKNDIEKVIPRVVQEPGIAQEGDLNLSKAKPSSKQFNLNKLNDADGSQIQRPADVEQNRFLNHERYIPLPIPPPIKIEAETPLPTPEKTPISEPLPIQTPVKTTVVEHVQTSIFEPEQISPPQPAPNLTPPLKLSLESVPFSPFPATSTPEPVQKASPEDLKTKIRHETLMRFAAVELEGTLKNQP
jgi:hypothetical protein